MLVSIILVLVIALGGFAVTYLFAEDEPLMWRIAAGNVIGSAVFGTLAFGASMAAGFGAATVMFSLLGTLVPLLILRRSDVAGRFKTDRTNAAATLRGSNVQRLMRFAFYAFFFLLFVFFFRRGMIETPQGIFTGGSQNLGDLPFHLGAIFGFVDGGNFPPQNPSFAGARFSYPFIADLVTACFMRIGAGVSDAMFVQHVSWAMSLLVILERFVANMTGHRLAGRIAPALLFFSGGLGFVAFFADFNSQARPLTEFLWHLPFDYTIGEKFRWGNSLVVMFITQRSLLLGMPLTLLVLGALWKAFTTERDRRGASLHGSVPGPITPLLVVGLLAGLLPLVHLHSLAVLFVTGVFLVVLQPKKWKLWTSFALGAAVLSVPELIWSMSGSASETSKFIGWHFGWNKNENESFFWFWVVNTGIFIPVLATGLYLVSRDIPDGVAVRQNDDRPREDKRRQNHSRPSVTDATNLLLFYLPFAFLFVASNVAKFAPWEWDNIKILIYWFAGSIPFAAYALSWLWRRNVAFKAAAATLFVVLTLSGALDVWRTASGQINYKVFDRDAVALAEKLKQTTAPTALFLNAPTYNTAIVLSGRRSLMRYTGHLSSHGIDYSEREGELKRIYLGGPDAAGLMEKYGIDYVLISPEERTALTVNEPYFAKYPIAAEAGQYRVYKVR